MHGNRERVGCAGEVIAQDAVEGGACGLPARTGGLAGKDGIKQRKNRIGTGAR